MADKKRKYEDFSRKNEGNQSNLTGKRISNLPSKGVKGKKEGPKVNNGVFTYAGSLTVSQLANQLKISPADIIKYLFMQGKMVTINASLDDELIGEVCLEYGYDFKKEKLLRRKILKN